MAKTRLLRALDLSEGRIEELTRPLLPECARQGASFDELVERFSLICLSNLVEPGDRVAKELCVRVGASELLASLAVGLSGGGNFALDLAREGSNLDHPQLSLAFERWSPRFQVKKFRQSFELLAKLTCIALTDNDSDWPSGLDDLEFHSPILLYTFCQSDAKSVQTSLSLAMVGSRAISPYGRWVAKEFSETLVQNNVTVVSGGAYGVDAVAHQSALNAGGNTVAIMAGGLDQLYPRGNAQLLGEIRSQGKIFAEVPPGFTPTKWRFLQRNRLIAAMSQATLVVEAGHRSGSINTANHANQLGREVGAVPGPVSSASSMGCHRLIRDGKAQLVASSNDLLELIGPADEPARIDPRMPEDQVRVLDALGARGNSEESIAVRSGMSLLQCQIALSHLELEGLAGRKNQKWVRVSRTL